MSDFSYDSLVNSASQIRKRIANQFTSSQYNTDSNYIDFFNNWDVTNTSNFSLFSQSNNNCKTLCDLSANCYGYIAIRDSSNCYIANKNADVNTITRYTDDSNDASFNVLKYKCIDGSCNASNIKTYLDNMDDSFNTWISDISTNVGFYNNKNGTNNEYGTKNQEYYYLKTDFKPFNATSDDLYNTMETTKQTIRSKTAEYASLEDPVNVETHYYRFMILFILAIILTITFLYLTSSVNEDSELAYLNVVWYIAILMSLFTVFLAMYFT